MQVPTHAPLDGIVLHLGKVGDSHRLVEVLTVQQGRLSLLARGARASKRRFGGVLEVFASLRLHVAPGRESLPTLQAADVVDGRFAIRHSFEAIGRASLLCACVRRLVPEHQAVPEVYDLLRHGLDALARGALAAAATVYPRLAAVSGILPDLRGCAVCARETSELAVAAGTGVPVCRCCAPRADPLSPSALQALRGAPVSDEAAAATVEKTVMAWIAAHTGKAWRGVAPFVP